MSAEDKSSSYSISTMIEDLHGDDEEKRSLLCSSIDLMPLEICLLLQRHWDQNVLEMS